MVTIFPQERVRFEITLNLYRSVDFDAIVISNILVIGYTIYVINIDEMVWRIKKISNVLDTLCAL